jgi:hypothetical protein
VGVVQVAQLAHLRQRFVRSLVLLPLGELADCTVVVAAVEGRNIKFLALVVAQ